MEDTGTERGQLTQSQRLSPTTLVDTTAAIMARGVLMLSQKPNHTGHTMQEDTTSLARDLLMLSQKLSPTGHTMEDTGMARGLLTPSQRHSHTTWVDTTAAIMARGLLMLSQRLNHTGHTMELAAIMVRGLLMQSQRPTTLV